MRVCCSSASSARTCMPAGSGRTSTVTLCSRAVGSISRATAAITGRQVHHFALRALPARQAQKVLRDAAAAQDLLARDGGAFADPRVRHRVSRRIPSTHVSTVASGVFSSCENPDASVPTDASRCDSARCASAARRSEMSRHTSTTCCRRPAESRIGEAWTSSQTSFPSGVRRSQMRTCRAPDARQASVGQSATVQPPGVNSRHWQPSTCSRECSRAQQERIVGGDHVALRRPAPRCRRRCC